VKKMMNKFLQIMDNLTYFLPDVFLALATAVYVSTSNIIFTTLLLINYFALGYGEYYYHKVKTAREMMINNVVPRLNELEKVIKKRNK
jgi:hypothetical protein